MYPTPNSYNCDPVKIHRAELRAELTRTRLEREAMEGKQPGTNRFALPSVRRLVRTGIRVLIATGAQLRITQSAGR